MPVLKDKTISYSSFDSLRFQTILVYFLFFRQHKCLLSLAVQNQTIYRVSFPLEGDQQCIAGSEKICITNSKGGTSKIVYYATL